MLPTRNIEEPKKEGDNPVEPYKTAETRTLTKDGGDQIDLEGGAIFTELEAGTYWVGELNPPTGYVHNETLTRVIVENDGEHPGVYADAGEANDGVTVLRGVGRIVRSMVQFATDDDIDLTLHEIVATPMVGEEVGAWEELKGANELHLEYSTDTDTVLDYKPSSGYTERFIEVDEGIPYLEVKQCKEHREEPSQNIEDIDVTNLYTGVTIVRIANVHEGDFELSKTVEPESVDNEKFTFELSFGQNIDATLDEGVANYIKTLLPDEYDYTVKNASSTIESGKLTIAKIAGDEGESGAATPDVYAITSVPDSEEADGRFVESTETAGTYDVQLKDGETLIIHGLPVGTEITATEQSPEGDYLTTVETVNAKVNTTKVTAAGDETGNGAGNASDGSDASEGVSLRDEVDAAEGVSGESTDSDSLENGIESSEVVASLAETNAARIESRAATVVIAEIADDEAEPEAPAVYGASIAFTNTKSVSVAFDVQKTLVGTTWEKSQFTFKIVPAEGSPDNTPMPIEGTMSIDVTSDDERVVDTDADKEAAIDSGPEVEEADGTDAVDEPNENVVTETAASSVPTSVKFGRFGEVNFTEMGTFTYDIYEIVSDDPENKPVDGDGWTYDHHVARVTVTVATDATTGELKAEVVYNNAVENKDDANAANDSDRVLDDIAAFTNTYELEPESSANLSGTKSITEREFLNTDTFAFEVAGSYDPSGTGYGNIEQGSIPLPANVIRSVAEKENLDSGMIVIPGQNGTLSGYSYDFDFGIIKFTQPGTYTYTISEQVPDGATNTALVDAEGNPITYGEATPEQQAMEGWTLNGVTYDRTSFTVTYTVTDDGDGTMTVAGPAYGIIGAEADDPVSEPLTWKNTYEASGETEAELDFAKVLVGKDWVTDDSETTDVNEADSFTFTLTPLGGTTDTTFEPGEDFDPENLPEGSSIAAGDVPMPMPEGEDGTSVPVTEVTVSAATGTVNVDGATYDAADFSFGPIAYAAAGKYYYQVTENVPQQDADPYNGAMTYSTKTVVVEVTVTDNLKGGFTASVAYLGEAEDTVRPQFTNMYGTELDYGTEGGLNIEKSLDGRDIKNGEFQFVVTAQDSATADKFGIENSGTEADPVYTKTVTLNTDQPVDTATGIATATLENVLGSATFTQNDAGVTYKLTVHEVKGTQGGVTYDDVTYTLTITTADDGRGHLTVTTEVVSSDQPEGTDSDPYFYTNGEDQNNPVTLEFSNAYDASTTSEGALGIEGAKTLTNANIAGYEGKFTFALSYVYSNENGEQVTAPVLGGDNGTTPVKTTNDDEGNFAFPAMAYTTDQLWSDVKSGIAKYDAATDTFTYTYRVSEDTSDLPEGVTGVSGATSFDVTVTVADNGNGTLKATPAYPQSGSTIKNTYGTGAEDQVVLSGTKVLSSQEGDNPPSIAGQYTFTLTAPEGTPLPQGEGGQTVTTASNDASGSVLFGTITYTMEDLNGATLIDTDGHRYKDFTYTVTESGSVTGVTNDAQPTRTVTVRVTDNGNGTLSAKIVDGNGTEVQGSSFTFTNTYTAVEVTLEATKRVVGAASVEPFTFTLTQMPEEGAPNNVYVLQNGELVAFESETATTVESIADGETDTVSFGELVFTAAGTYTFQVVENEAAGTAPDHWTYDKSVKTITVNVAADEGGKLTATTIVDGQETNDPTFINTYYNGEEAKTVHNPTTDPEVNIDGQLVGVGSVLEYRIDWVNNAVNGMPTSVDVVIEDTIPAGTELVEGSINPGTDEDAGIRAEPATDVDGRTTITWTLANRAPGDRGTVSFQVRVTEDAIEGFEGEDAPALTNQATVTAGNKYETNITSNPLPEKTSSDDTSNDGVKLGDTLTFTITYTNGEDEPATVMVSDTLSSGLTYEADSWTITDSEDNLIEGVDFKQNGQTLTWTISNVAAGESGTVSFKATVNENAVTGTDPITNKATVKVGDNPAVDTNTTTDEVEKGELSITKVVASNIADAEYDTKKTFTFTVTLTKGGQPLTGPYTYSVDGGESQPLSLDDKGAARIVLSNDQIATIGGLPVGAHYEVTEADYSGDGFTTSVTDGSSTGDIAANNAVTFTNTYGATGELSGDAALTVTKSIDSRAWQDGDSFEFTLSAGDDATKAAVDKGDVVLPSGEGSNPVTITNSAADHTATFGAITFNQTGTYTFAITETVPDEAVNPSVEGGTVAYGDATDEQKAQLGWTLNGLTYDNQLHTVTVTVKDNGNGKLTATPAEGTADLAVEIANGYEASGSLSLAATKQLKNDEIAEYDGAFKFTVSVSKADGTSKTVSLGTNDETGAIAFDAIDYTIEKLEDDVAGGYAQRGTDAGGNRTYTYVYTVAEDASGLPDGVTAGVANHTVTVVVTDDGNGNLTAAVTDPVGYDGGKGLVFENTYGASGKAEITVGGTKTYATAGTTNAPDIAGKYTFTLTGADGAPMPKGAVEGKLEVTNATGGASEDISFGTITYTMDDLDGATDTDDDGKRDRTFTYTVTESGTVEGVDNDSDAATGKTFTVTLVDNGDGTINATCSETTNAQFAFTNTYRVDPVTTEAPLEGTKAMDGRAFQTGDTFTFTIEGERESDGAAAPLPSKATPTGEGATTGTVTITPTSGYEADIDFGTIKFTEPGTYIYTVSESDFDAAAEEAMPNVEKDPTVFTVTYVVTDKGDGTMSVGEPTYAVVGAAEGSEAPAGLAWTNTYTAEMDYDAAGGVWFKKTLTGYNFGAGKFSFTVTANDDGSQEKLAELVEGDLNLSSPALTDGVAASWQGISGLTFDQDDAGKMFTFVVTETVPEGATKNDDGTYTLAGITYDGSSVTVAIEVFDNGDGTMHTVTTVTKNGKPQEFDSNNYKADDASTRPTASFANSYEAADAVVSSLSVRKAVEGAPNDEDFTFTATFNADASAERAGQVEGGVAGIAANVSPATLTAIVDEDFTAEQLGEDNAKTASLGTVTFTEPGIYVFDVKETNTAAGLGWTYDKDTEPIIVTVTDDGTGQLEASTAFGTEGDTNSPLFVNSYATQPTTVDGETKLAGSKTLTGRDALAGETFTFELIPDEATKEAIDAGNLVLGATTAEVSGLEDGEPVAFHFGDITVKVAGTYDFTVQETQHNGKELPADGTNGMTYDRHIGTVQIVADETTTGQFDITVTTGTVTDGAQEDDLTFENSYTPDPVSFGIDEAFGGTKTVADESGHFEFEAGQFTFILRAQNANNPLPSGDGITQLPSEDGLPGVSVTNGAPNENGEASFDFGSIEFTEPGTYIYNIFEDTGEMPDGVSADDAQYTLTITVSENEATGELYIADGDVVAVKVVKGTGEDSQNIPVGTDEFDFTNTYDAGQTDYNQPILKNLVGRDFLAKDSFVFEVVATATDLEGNPMAFDEIPLPDGTTTGGTMSEIAENETGDGYSYTVTINPFGSTSPDSYRLHTGKVTYTHEGIYTYTISEVPGSDPNITYSDAEYTVVVTVEVNDDDPDNPVLTRSVAIDGATVTAGNTIDFTNAYSTTGTLEGELAIEAAKAITGRDWLDADSFTVTLAARGGVVDGSPIAAAQVPMPLDESGEVADTLVLTKTNPSGVFGDIVYTQPGTYNYRLTEVGSGTTSAGITYSRAVYDVVVTAVDNDGDGTMTVTSTMTRVRDDAGTALNPGVAVDDRTALFTNTYTTTGTLESEGEFAIKVTKSFTGRENDEWLDTDSFKAMLTAQDSTVDGQPMAAENVPMPDGRTGGAATVDLTKDNHENVAFGDIAYTRPGTYNYTLTEVQENSIDGVYYSLAEYDVVVTATDDGDGTMTVTSQITQTKDNDGFVSGEEGYIGSAEAVDVATFGNVYQPNFATLSGVQNLTVAKNLVGRDWFDTDEWTFTLALADGDASQVIMPAQTQLTINASTPNFQASFGDITFRAAGTYTFTVTESGVEPGVTNDEQSVRTITVKVVDNHDGTLTASVTSITAVGVEGEVVKSDLTFTNTYDPADATLEGDGAIKVQKTLTGRAWAEGEAYSFTITNVQAPEGVEAPMPVVDGAVSDTITVGAPAEGAVNTAAFGTMTFSQAGTYVYTISEKAPVEGDENFSATMAYDTHVATVTVAVFEDQAAGALWTQVSYDNSAAPSADDQYVAGAAAFTNVQALSTTLDLAGTKTLEGRDFQAGDSFTFTVTADDGAPAPVDAEGNVVSEVTINPTAGSVATVDFGTITFTAAGEYVYRIAEQAGSASGMTYDTVEHAVIVTVTDDGQGNLTAAVAPETAANLAWTNSWTFVPGKPFSLSGTKTLTGAQLHNGEFTFLVEPQDGAPMGDSLPAAFNGEPAQSEDGSWTAPVTLLSNITFTAPGDYVYLVSEVNDGRPGYTYDASKYRVTVHVAQDGSIDWTVEKNSNGELNDEGNLIWTAVADNAVAFSNSYTVTEDGTLDGSVNLAGTKTLEGRDWIADAAEGYVNDSFTFVLAAGDEATQAAIDGNPDEGVDPTVVMPAETAVVLQGGYTDGQQVPFSFGDITFKAAGVYTFTIAEQQPSDEGFVGNTGGMAYDSHVRTVVVSVVDNGMGGLTATVVTEPTENIPVATNGDTNWTNTYTPVFDGATTVNLNGTKVLEGSTLAAGQFFFSVTPLDGAPMGDTWEFGNTNGLGVNGALENVGDIELLRNITYTVADMGDATEKTFRYVVTEEIPSEGDRMPGLAYDGSAYLASVTVTDDLAGNLVASAPSIERGVWDGTTFTADEDQAGVEGVVFTNGYTVDGTTAAPVQVTKVLAGNRTAPLAAGEFEFELGIVSADPADGLTLPEETTASNAADGTVSFGEVSFSKPGTYVLSVAEVVPEGAEQNGDGSYTLDGVTYDTHAVTMTYTVVDQNAQLVATLGAVEGDTTFTNTYNATETLDGAANLTVTKAVEGDFTWKEGTSFTFALTGADIATQEAIANGTVVLPDNADGIAIAYNAADPDAPHTASFGDITFKAAGDYLFAITEQQGDIAGMTYDVEQHLVSVAVTDNGDGTLAVVPDADTVNPTITNTYEPTEAVLSGAGNLTVTKNLVGRDWQEGDSFTFVLEADMDDETTADAMNDGAIRLPGNAGGITVAFDANDPEAAHSASFGDIAFTRAGTYRFTVTELAGSIDGVVYDTAAHEVVVTVVDNGDGTLGFAADGVVGANPTVTNVFTAPIDYSARSEIVISKTLDGRPATDGQFSFTVTPADEASALKLGIPEDGYTLSTPAAGDGEKATVGLFATLAADGIAPLAFTRDDAGTTFSYTVTENGTAPDGYTYDASVYTVDIAVTDDPSAGGLTVATQVSDGASYTMMTTVTNATEFAQPVEIPFVNSYRASTDVEGGTAAVVNGTKELVGTAMREFSFALEGVAGTNTEGYTNTAVNGEDGSFSFALDYDQDSFTAGATADENGNRSETFVYTLREVGGGDVTGGITYDDARYRVTVTVTDNGDGTMVASVTKLEQRFVDEAGVESWISADAAAFTNTYAAATSVALDVDKVLSGRDMTAADSYEFVAYAYDRATQAIDRTSLVATGSTPAGQTAADGAAVPVDMSDIEYTIEKLNADTATPWVDVTDEAGQPTGARTKTYDYAIEEVVGSDLNISYAPEVFYAQVVVTDDGQGNLTATKAYFADAAMQQPMVGEDGSSTVPTFVNTYLPDATSFHLTGTKTTTFVNVDPGTEPELRFMYDIYLEENGASELVASGWSYANGTVSADIPVTGEGSFTYRIVERYAGTTSGTVTYDDAVYYLTLEVARNADTGIYDFAPTYYRVEDDGTWTQIDAAGLTFANTYDGAAGTTVSLGATKVLEGATFEQLGQLNDKFGFSLYEGDDATGTYLGEGTITGVDANGNGIVTFPNLSYTFYLQDQPAAETPDEGEQPEGGETAETPGEGAETGQPDGSAEGTEGEVPEGGQTDQGGQTGTGENGTTVPSDPNAGQPSGEGGATEPDQPAADVPAETPSVDETPAVEGTPEVAPEAPAEDASGDASVQTASIADLFVASEAIADDADAEPFTVDIVDAGAEVAEPVATVAEQADGQTGTSGETAPAAPAEPVIVSDDLGTHVYTIVENVPAGSTQNEDGTWTAPNGVTYDGTKYRVTVEVAASYDAATQKATMTATVTGIARSDSHGSFEDGHATPVDPTNPAASIVFTNSYAAKQPVEVSFAGTKNLTGRDMAEGEFSFAVLEGETPVATATNAADGTVSFSFGVTTPGTHTYTVVEADGGKGGVDYDTAPRTVTVEVGVNPDGTLAVESVALPEGGLVFNNTYTASGSTEAVIEGTKALTGRTMAEGEFRFVVVETVDGIENIVAAGENQAPDEDGVAAITFAPIAYDAEDLGKTFTYQVRELDLGAGGVTYDTAAFTVQVAVVDDLDGTISTEVTYLDGPVAFENSYGTVDGAKVEVTPEATKTLTGRDMADGEFVFTVTDAATGDVVATGANTADGKVVWDAPITLTAKGDYEFAIAEVNGRQDGVTYDDATYRLLVTVADDGEGGLTVESLDYPDGAPAFSNSYEEPEKPADPDKPSIPGGPTESIPQTGDDTNLAAAAALGLGGLGAALLGGGALLRRRASR